MFRKLITKSPLICITEPFFAMYVSLFVCFVRLRHFFIPLHLDLLSGLTDFGHVSVNTSKVFASAFLNPVL